MKIKCKCGIIFENESVEVCPICSFNEIHPNWFKDYQKTNIVAKDKKEYMKEYQHLDYVRNYKADWMRKKRAEQRVKFGGDL